MSLTRFFPARITGRKGRPLQWSVLVFHVAAASLFFVNSVSWAQETLRVGIFQNKPIVYYDQEARGLFVDVLNEVASRQDWILTYVQCELKNCLEMMENKEIDIMTSLGKNPARTEKYVFSKEPIWTFWGTVYASDITTNSLLDLGGKRIGVRSNNKVTAAIKRLLGDFNIRATFVSYDNYDEMLQGVKRKETDAIAVNNTYGFSMQHNIPLHKTPIVFNPFSAYFAMPANSRHLHKLNIIDSYVSDWREDEKSVFHDFERKWFSRERGFWTARKIGYASGGILAVVVAGMALFHYFSLYRLNIQLKQHIDERLKAESALHQAQASLEKKVAERTSELRKEVERGKQLEARLAQEMAFLQIVLDTVGDGVVACDKDGRLILFNKAAREFHGLPLKKIAAESWAEQYDLYRPDGASLMPKEEIPLFRALQGEYVSAAEMIVRPRNVPERYIEASAKPLVGEDTKIVGAVVSMHDITFEKKAEQQLLQGYRQLETKVRERTLELQKSYERLEQESAERLKAENRLQQTYKMEAIGTLAGGIAHDFNNILMGIQGYSELVFEDLEDGSQGKRYIQNVLAACNRAKDLVQHLLIFSRSQEFSKQPLDLSQTIKEALRLLRATLPATIHFSLDIDSHVGLVLANATQIHQVVINLCTNAAHAMEEQGGVLTVSLKESKRDDDSSDGSGTGKYATIRVADTGQGIAEEHRERIFEPFFTTKETGKGTGMGLAVTHGIIKSHGGDISLSSLEGKGTSFTIHLPIIEAVISTDAHERDIAKGHGERILVVDDEHAITDFLSKALGRLGYQVTSLTKSFAALEVFSANPDGFDLIITDHTMPDLTGYQMAERILKIRPDIPIVLCTGYSSNISEEVVLAAGIAKFAYKPITQRKLSRIIADLFTR